MPTKMNFRGIKNKKSASTIHQKYLLLNMWIGLNNILEDIRGKLFILFPVPTPESSSATVTNHLWWGRKIDHGL